MGKKGRKGVGGVRKRGSLKRQIRDTERLLSRESLPETVRQSSERILKSLKKELHQQAVDKKNQKLMKQYKMVKFFERKKVLRKLNGAVQEMSGSQDDEERADLETVISRLRKELNYVVHFPAGTKYLSLYPSSASTDEESTVRRDQLLTEISDQVARGDLPDISEDAVGRDYCRARIEGTTVGLESKLMSTRRSTEKSGGKGSEGSESKSDCTGGGDRTSHDDFFLDVTGNFDHQL